MVTHFPPVPVSDDGIPTPVFRLTVEDVRRNGWILFLPTILVHWCGHGQKVLPIPAEDGKCDLLPVIGETS